MRIGKTEKTIVSFKIWNRETEETDLYALKEYRINGAEEGPHVVINAGSHGDEFLAIDTAKALYDRLDPEQVAGRISIIPEANVFAATARSRETPVPGFETYVSEERNLNRCFNRFDPEEEPTGNITEQLAYHILHLVKDADYCIDLHTATRPSYKIEQIRSKIAPTVTPGVQREQANMVRGSGLTYVIKSPVGTIGEGVLAGVAPQHGTPTVTIEIGSGPYAEEELERYVVVVNNILRTVGTLPGAGEDAEQQIYRNLVKVAAPTAGRYQIAMEPGETVRKGDVLGTIENDEGTFQVTCPYDGLVESVHQEDWVNEGTRVCFIATRQQLGIIETIVRGVVEALRFGLSRQGTWLTPRWR